ncbi:hypothetical protein GCM10009623_26190 [Nocardioides aestuarii]|uniref:Ig-like domain-containing protein n=1 Tax=Nocardioides aestuarii TaxID=252231 RepID=A0ABW4TQP8_9ACTN
MSRLGRALALTTAATALVAVPATPASAEPPDCDVRTYAGDDVLELREGKPWGIRVDCWSSAASEALTVHRQPDRGTAGTPYIDEDFPEEWVVPYDPPGPGDDSLTLKVSDGTEDTLIDVAIRVTPNHQPGCGPTYQDDEVFLHTKVDEPAPWTVECGDIDLQDYGDLQPVVERQPAHGTLEVSAGTEPGWSDGLSVTYTPDPGFEGSDHFVAAATDGDLSESFAFFVNVSDGPWCAPSDPLTLRAGTTERLLPLCSSPEPDDLEMSVTTPPNQGSTSLAWMAIDYTAAPDASGSDSFTFQVSGSSGTSNVVTQEVTILPNAAPVCEDRSATTPRDEPIEVTLTCTDADGDDHELTVADQPSHGTLGELTDGTVTYTPDAGWDGTDSFTYVASDYARTSTPATVTVRTTEPDPPVLRLRAPDQTPRQVAHRGLRVRIQLDETAATELVVRLPRRVRRQLGLPAGPVGFVERELSPGWTRVVVPLKRRAERAIADRRRLVLLAGISASDEHGNVVHADAAVRLR